MQTSVTTRIAVCAVAAALVLVDASSSRADFFYRSYARGAARAIESVDQKNGPMQVAQVAGSSGGAVYRASASASMEVGGVGLHAYAFAEAPSVITEQTFLSAASAEARAEWYDDLTLANFEALPLGFVELVAAKGLQITVYPNISGDLSGRNCRYILTVSLNGTGEDQDFENGRLFQSYEERIGGQVTELSEGNLPVGIVYPNLVSLHNLVLTVQMSLGLDVSSRPGTGLPTSGPSEADFSHTVRLGPLIISDASGNYLPGSEHLQFVGDSGIVYSVQPVPEPSTYALALCGALGCFAARRRRAWSV